MSNEEKHTPSLLEWVKSIGTIELTPHHKMIIKVLEKMEKHNAALIAKVGNQKRAKKRAPFGPMVGDRISGANMDEIEIKGVQNEQTSLND